jgi:hypothetical protein
MIIKLNLIILCMGEKKASEVNKRNNLDLDE